MNTEIIWTALPNGRTESRLHLSVHVTPRLTLPGDVDGTLAQFPLLAAWPPPDLAFEVLIDGTQRFEAELASAAPDATLWKTLFPPSSRVASHRVIDRSSLPIHTYPVARIAAWLRDQYAQTAIDSGENFPAIDDLLGNGWDDICFSGRDGRNHFNAVRQTLLDALERNRVLDTSMPSTPALDFVQLEDFFAPVDVSNEEDEESFLRPVEAPTLDVHAVVQFVNQHPPLLRMLGLVFDLDIDDRDDPIPLGNHTVEVVPLRAEADDVTHRRPRTRCEISPTRFRAASRPGSTHLGAGFLRLEDTDQFQVVQVEADGGGLKAVDRAGNLRRTKLHPTADSPSDAALATLRADGISVARVAQGKHLRDRIVQGVQQEADLKADTLELYADDLLRGLRVDVWDGASNRWYSLMERTGRYEVGDGSLVIPVSDEGFVTSNATSKPLRDDLYVTEELFHWDGWSLAAPRPGKVLGIDPSAEDPLLDRHNDPGPDFDARFDFNVTPGTLPRLRYGVDYRLRARTVDLAGNSLPPTVTEASNATPTVRYGRFEPPQTPPVLLRTPRGPAESMDTVALRSNFDTDPSPVTAERHLVPPKVGQLAVELHSMLDVPDAADPTRRVLDKGAYDLLVGRDDATLINHPHAAVDPDDHPDTRYYDVDDVAVTWTPDPAITALAFRLLDGPHAGHLEACSLFEPGGQEWPRYAGVRLVAVEGSGPPSFDADTRVLKVPLRKADIVRVRLSSIIDGKTIDQFGLWGWIQQKLPPGPAGTAKRAALLQLIASGQHWMFEPYRILTLVHATRQPLARPELPEGLIPNRQAGQVFTELSGPLRFHRRSTERVDLLASWEYPIDDGPESPDDPVFVGDAASGRVVRQTAATIEIQQGDELDEVVEQLRIRHEIGDTRHHVITYRAIALSRFVEYMATRDTITYDGPGATVILDTGKTPLGVVHGSVKLHHALSDGATATLIEGEDYTVDDEAGSITFGDGIPAPLPVGSPMQATYVVPPVTRETSAVANGADAFGPAVVSVPSSIRPAAPRVRYVVPAFRWESKDVTSQGHVVQRTSTRHGQLLRVYLDRPWWSSGVGELLGVVTWPQAEGLIQPELADDDLLRPFVTQWGEDPIFSQRVLTPRYPRGASFPRRVAHDTGLTLSELGGAGSPEVNVSGHEVGFDTDRKLWFADVQVNAGSAYVPFVRLALARWQPDSIVAQELSPIVLADFVQLAPNRSATVVFDSVNRALLQVTLTGPTHHGSNAVGSHPGAASIVVEKRRDDITGDLAWKEVGNVVAMTGSVSNGIGTWSAQVDLGEPPVPGDWRLIVEQSERLAEEPLTVKATANPSAGTKPIPVDRLVFTDVIPL